MTPKRPLRKWPHDMFENNTGSVPLFQKEIKRKCKGQSVIILNCGDKVET